MRIGAAQIDIKWNDKVANLKKCGEYAALAHREHVDLLVFPECTLTGYVYDNPNLAAQAAETVPGKSTERLAAFCREYQISIVAGLLEKEKACLYNTAVLITPGGLEGKYRKTHLLHLGVDRYTVPGDEMPVFTLPQATVATLICYDLRAPEPSRSVALKGAQIILCLTNLPRGAKAYADFINRTRACENRVFLVSANRVGLENGTQFIGKSQILNTGGQILAMGSIDREELIYADILPAQADEKHIVNIPGEYEFDVFADRRPELYGAIVKRHD